MAKTIKWEDLKKIADEKKKLVNTVEVTQSAAYDKALDAVRDKDGHVDYDLLENEGVAEKVAEAAGKEYQKEAEKELKSSGVKGPMASRLQKAYAGSTEHTILDQLRAKGKAYTKKEHTRMTPEFMREVEQDLDAAVYNQIGRKQVESALGHIKADFIDSKTVPLEVARGLVQGYLERGEAVTPQALKGKHYLKKTA